MLVNQLLLIGVVTAVFLGLAKISDKREHKGWVIAGIVVGIIEILLVFNFLAYWLDKIA